MQNRVVRLGQLVVMGAMASMLTGFDGGGCGGGIQDPPPPCPASRCVGDCEHGLKRDANGCEICECEVPPAPPADKCQGLDERSCLARTDCQPNYDAGPPRPTDPSFCMPLPPKYAGCESKPQVCPDVMCALWCENGYVTDENGCATCACKGSSCATDSDCAPDEFCDFSGDPRAVPPCEPGKLCDPQIEAGICRPNSQCSPVMCELYCEFGFQRDPATGCEVCACNPPPACQPVTCKMYCEYGFQKDASGCEICACNPAPQCQPLACRMNCPYGLEQDANGCDICACKPPPGSACLSDSDCRPGQDCEWPVTCAGLDCPRPTAGHCTDVVCSSDADCGPGSSCQPDPNDPCNQPDVACTTYLPIRMICLPKPPPPPQGCTADSDCAPGQRCEPGVTCTALNCPPPVNQCVDNTCSSDSDCAAGSSCQPDPTDPCNQPNVLCFAPGRTICLPKPPACESISDERTCSATPGCKPTYGTPCPPGMVCPQVIKFSCLPACDGLTENVCLARADCSAVYGPSACAPDGTCTTDMVFKACN